jgi:hypothetical protein
MAELTTSTLIKVIIGVIVVVVVIIGIGAFFGARVMDFFKNLFETQEEVFLSLIK